MKRKVCFTTIRFGFRLVICLVLIMGLEVRRSESISPRKSSLVDDCRRRRKPLRPGEFALDGIWLDHRNNHNVRIRQNGSNYNQTAELRAYYVDPLECPNPNPNLTEDFFGDLQNKNLRGEIYLCRQIPEGTNIMPAGCKRKSGVSTGTNGAPVVGDMRRVTCEVTYAICGKFFHRTQVETNRKGACQSFFASVKASLPKEQVCCDCYPKCCSGCDLSEAPTEPGLYNIPPGSPGKRDTTSKPPPKLDLSVAEDGKSMTGTYLNPYSNQQETIYLTLEKKLAPGGGDNRGMYDDDWVTYYPNTVMYATGATKIYADASSASGVKMTLPAGTQMMMEHVILGPDGNPAWYFVTDNSSVGGTKWHGFVPAPMVRCPGVNQNRPPS